MTPLAPTLSLSSLSQGAELAAAQANGAVNDADFSALLELSGDISSDMETTPALISPAQTALPDQPGILPVTGNILPPQLPLAPGLDQSDVADAISEQPEQPAHPRGARLPLPAMTAPLSLGTSANALSNGSAPASDGDAVQSASELVEPALTSLAIIAPLLPPVPDQTHGVTTPAALLHSAAASAPVPAPDHVPMLPQAARRLPSSIPPADAEGSAAPASAPTIIATPNLPAAFRVEADTPRQLGQIEARFQVALPAAFAARPSVPPLMAGTGFTAARPGTDAPVAGITPVLAIEPGQPQLAGTAFVQQPAVQPGPSAAAPIPEPIQRPHDFAALVDRLVAARDTLQPNPVSLAIQHADFGQISLRLRHDGDALGVTLASADPDFARAVNAATTPVLPVLASEQAGQTGGRPDAQSGQNAGAGGTFSQSRGSASERRDDHPQRQPGSEPHRLAQQRPKGDLRGGIFA